ncbi:Thymidylate kinase [Astathelohania contejeani]|uniref:dTMP kinase n=1 Tax=Astathelohania contejeani TaxID=164912 RepID=A0ABQ7I1Q4_9MICR|nr:Thymidylate kinase [Thelohania contejeani]
MKGKFIVVEGIDKSGKTTICKKVAELLRDYDVKNIIQMGFPERSTEIGKIIDSYLKKKIEFDPHTIHLLFSANRWEYNSKIVEWIEKGNIIICDRYYYSGIAYSLSNNLDKRWCSTSDSGLIEPDLVIFIDISSNMVNKRNGFGDEIYENTEYLEKTSSNLKELIQKNKNHIIIDGLDTPENISSMIVEYLRKNLFK